MIHTQWNVASLEAGEVLEIEVAAVDAAGAPATFTATAEPGGCATVTAAADAITVSAVGETCSQRIVLRSSSGIEKELRIEVVDPAVMDIGEGLLVKYVNAYSWQWNDRDSGGTYYVSYWHPITEVGWYALGSIARNTWDDPTPEVPMVIARDSRGAGTLAAPTGYDLVYNDRGSGGRHDGSMWKPRCPSGYVALGVVTGSGYSAPSTEAVRCVRAGFTTPGKVGRWLYDDVGTGATMYLSLWSLDYPEYTSSADGRAALHAGTTLGCAGWHAYDCDPAIVNLLLVPVPVVMNGDASALEPRLTGYQELDVDRPRYFSSVRLPFTLVRGEAANAGRMEWNVHHSPFYRLQREERYVPIDVVDNRQGTEPVAYTYQITTGFDSTKASTFSQEVGLEITAGGEAKFLGSGGSWEVKLTGKLGWEQTTSSTYSIAQTRSYGFTIPAGKFAEVVQVCTQFRAVDEAGQDSGTPLEGRSSIIKYLQYPP